MREKIKLESTAGTGHFYTTTKNKRTTPDKIEIKKFDPRVRKHVLWRRGALASPALRTPAFKLTPETRAEVDGLLARLDQRLAPRRTG